jgi:hypothetical protein
MGSDEDELLDDEEYYYYCSDGECSGGGSGSDEDEEFGGRGSDEGCEADEVVSTREQVLSVNCDQCPCVFRSVVQMREAPPFRISG